MVAVKVVNAGENSRWYAGSGIYRHVWLIMTEKVHLDEWDTFIDASQLKSRGATVEFSTVIHNKTGKALAILQPDGKEGKMELTVSSDGLKSAQVTIDTVIK